VNLKEALTSPDLLAAFDPEKIRLFKIWTRLVNLTARMTTVNVVKGRLVFKDMEAPGGSLAILLAPGRDDFRCGKIWITYIYGNPELQIQNDNAVWEAKSPKLTIHERIQLGDSYVCFPSLARVFLEQGGMAAESHLQSAMGVK